MKFFTLPHSAVHLLEHNELISYRSGVLPLLRLGSFFGAQPAPEVDFYVLVLGKESKPSG